MGVQVIDTDFKGSLPQDTVGLLIGRASSILQGLHVFPGVINPDAVGSVKVMVEAPKGIVSISPGDRIAQLLLLPSLHKHFKADAINRTSEQIGSTEGNSAYLTLDLNTRPLVTLNVEGKPILGLMDTGADRSIISKKDWARGWPVQTSDHSLRGLGYAQAPQISCRPLSWRDTEGHAGQFIPYVLDLPFSLWGRDILSDMGYQLSNIYSPESRQLMLKMGFRPDLGLGKNLQGRKSPVPARKDTDGEGLGFS